MGDTVMPLTQASATADSQTGITKIEQCLAAMAKIQSAADLLPVPIYHTEEIDEITWAEMEYKLTTIDNPAFNAPLLVSGNLATAGIMCRVDYKGVPGAISAIPGGGIPTKASEVDDKLIAGYLLVPLVAAFLATMTPGTKYILRSRQKPAGEGEQEWSVYHDQIIVW